MSEFNDNKVTDSRIFNKTIKGPHGDLKIKLVLSGNWTIHHFVDIRASLSTMEYTVGFEDVTARSNSGTYPLANNNSNAIPTKTYAAAVTNSQDVRNVNDMNGRGRSRSRPRDGTTQRSLSQTGGKYTGNRPLSKDGTSAFYANTDEPNRIAYPCMNKINPNSGKVFKVHGAQAFCLNCKMDFCNWCANEHKARNVKCQDSISSLTDRFAMWGTDQPRQKRTADEPVEDDSTYESVNITGPNGWVNSVEDEEKMNRLKQIVNGAPAEDSEPADVEDRRTGDISTVKSGIMKFGSPKLNIPNDYVKMTNDQAIAIFGTTPEKVKLYGKYRSKDDPEDVDVVAVYNNKFYNKGAGFVDGIESASRITLPKHLEVAERSAI